MVPRNLTGCVLESLSDSPVVLLQGARQTGKSTLVQHLAANEHPARYLTLDEPAVLAAATADPGGFIAGLGGPVVLDEVQRAPGLFLAIKADVDRNRSPGRYLLTGSANVMVLPRLSDSLAGRMDILVLWPFSQGELAGRREELVDRLFRDEMPPPRTGESSRELLSRVLCGGYPEALRRESPSRRRAWFESYVSTILHRDVRDLANIEGLAAMPRLLAFLASRSASLLNHAEVSRSLGIPASTLKRYMALLEATFLVQLLPAWAGNLGKRLVKSPKLYLSDTGMACGLLGLEEESALREAHLVGPLIEGFAVTELRKQAAWSRTRPRLFHFRTLAGREVDIVLESPAGKVVGVEVKASTSVGADDFRGLRALAEEAGARFHRGILLYQGRQVVPFGQRLHAVPLEALWQA